MAQRFKPDWPPLAQIAEELERARSRLQLEARTIADQVRSVVQAEYDKLRAEVEGLEREVNQQRTELQREGRETIEYAGLQAEIQTRQKVLSDLVARQSETATSERLRDTRASNIRIVDRAMPARSPVRPKKLLTLAVALILGLGLGAGLALLLDHVDNTVKDENDVSRLTALPVLAHVPLYQPLRAVSERPEAESGAGEADLASHHDPRSAFAEAFKNLRTSLLLASPDRPPRSIVVTSCEPSDGKSTVCLNLALVLTQMGRRVLVVDADLRRPRLHRMLGLAKDVGLSSALSGNAGAEEIVQETGIPHLFAVSSGPIPPNPSELLESPSLAALVERLRATGSFDHLFFDSPPALQVTDSVILASRMDASIVVVRAGKTARESLTQGMARLRPSRGHVVGVVLNALSEESDYYYHRYGRQRYYRGYSEEGQPGEAPRRRPRHGERRGRRAERA
jgi:capsular exopolysaccharide synthesis family protein